MTFDIGDFEVTVKKESDSYFEITKVELYSESFGDSFEITPSDRLENYLIEQISMVINEPQDVYEKN